MQSSERSHWQAKKSAEAQIPYSTESLSWDLQRLRNAWIESQSNRERSAIYGYLQAVYDLVSWWSASGRETDYALQAIRLRRLDPSPRESPFAAVIRCTADPAKVDKRTRSKWSRVMLFAANRRRPGESLAEFVGRNGGINACVARRSSYGLEHKRP
jgi:hypothetical protein